MSLTLRRIHEHYAFGDPLWVRENGQGRTRRGEVVGVLFISMEAVALEHHFFFFLSQFQIILQSNFCSIVFCLKKGKICLVTLPFLFLGALINLFSFFRQ